MHPHTVALNLRDGDAAVGLPQSGCVPTYASHVESGKLLERWPHEAQTQEQLLTAIFLYAAGAACPTEKLAYRAR
jgi:hypothetical protein